MIRYRVKSNNTFNSLYIRFKKGNHFDFETSTGIKIPKGKWSVKLQKVNQTNKIDVDIINQKLKDLKIFIDKEYTNDSIEGILIDNKWLKNKVSTFLNKRTNIQELDEKIFLIAFVNKFIEEAEKRINNPNNPIKKRTVQHYKTTKNKLLSYEKWSKKTLKLTGISLQFHENFITYLSSVQMLNNNTIGGYIGVLKQICRKAKVKGYNVNNDSLSSDFYTPENETNDTYLTIKEIKQIFEHNFTEDYLDNARDWLIISVWTGLRVSDLLTLNEKNIDNDFIIKDTLKTNFPVIIPIHKQVKKILTKRDGRFPRPLSDQNYNKYIKTVCKRAGITNEIEGAKSSPLKITDEGKKKTIYRKKFGEFPKYQLISSHIGRRSFATNHYGKLDTLTLMKITGHKTEKQFLEYIKITPKEYAIKLKSYWEKINFTDFVNS